MKDSVKTIAVNNPGGRPRQFRVQYRVDAQSPWVHSAVFGSPESAQQRADGLQQQGLEVRTIHFRLPTAA